MEAFETDMLKLRGKEMSVLMKGSKVTLFGDDTAVIEGQMGIKRLSDERIAFAIGKKELAVEGTKLRLLHLSEGLAVIGGKITAVRLYCENKEDEKDLSAEEE